MPSSPQPSFRETIQRHITDHGHHITLVSGGQSPRFAYTIGLSRRLGAELIFPGGVFFMADAVLHIVRQLAAQLGPSTTWPEFRLHDDEYGEFSLRPADRSWTTQLMLWAQRYYGESVIPAFQIVPHREHWTIDVPDLSKPWSAQTEPVWQWLQEPWTYPVPEKSLATTNLAALQGQRITEAARWEEDYWELFAGNGTETTSQQHRIVPLGMLLAFDESLRPVVDLPIEGALWREEESEWQPWG